MLRDEKTERVTDPTEESRRNARFTYASRRVQRIIDGLPALTEDQRRELATMLYPVTKGRKS
jgi:hypothetical protein